MNEHKNSESVPKANAKNNNDRKGCLIFMALFATLFFGNVAYQVYQTTDRFLSWKLFGFTVDLGEISESTSEHSPGFGNSGLSFRVYKLPEKSFEKITSIPNDDIEKLPRQTPLTSEKVFHWQSMKTIDKSMSQALQRIGMHPQITPHYNSSYAETFQKGRDFICRDNVLFCVCQTDDFHRYTLYVLSPDDKELAEFRH